MAKKKIEYTIESYGIYSKWDKESKKLPEIKAFTNDIPAIEDVEFGYILHIKGAKGKIIDYCIIHPPIKNENGELLPDFTGEYYIHSNDFRFFIGDCIWAPVGEKTGRWRIFTRLGDLVIAEMDFNVYMEP